MRKAVLIQPQETVSTCPFGLKLEGLKEITTKLSSGIISGFLKKSAPLLAIALGGNLTYGDWV